MAVLMDPSASGFQKAAAVGLLVAAVAAPQVAARAFSGEVATAETESSLLSADTDAGVDSGAAAANLGEDPMTHFTNADGVRGITGVNPDNLEVGESVSVKAIKFGEGSNTFMAENPGDIFVTDLGPEASQGQLEGIGVFGDRQDFAIQFSRESAFNNGIRPTMGKSNIFTIPANSAFESHGFDYVVTRLR
jgi:hypothetical protein